MTDLKYWKLPGVEKFLSDISENLDSGRNCLVFMPNEIDNNFYIPLKAILREESSCELLNTGSDDLNPIEIIFNRFIKDKEIDLNVDSFVNNYNSSRFIFVNLSGFDSNTTSNWLKFISEYSISCTQKDKNSRIKFCLFLNSIKGIVEVPQTGPALSHHLFYNYLSELDFYYIIRTTEDDLEFIDYELFKNLLFELVFPNIEIVFKILQEVNAFIKFPIETVTKHLQLDEEIAKKICEHKKNLFREIKFIDNLTTKHPLFDLWLSGLVSYRNCEFHPTILTYLNSQNGNLLINKVWLAHLKVFFPLVERQRIRLIDMVKKRVKPKILESILNENNETDIAKIEIGKLTYIIFKLRIPDKNIIDLAETCTKIRNSLAHLEPIDEDTIKKFVEKSSLNSVVSD